jgi:23S rRNA (adenine2030-N6)-methyltransferase
MVWEHAGAVDADIAPYLAAITAMNKGDELRLYPGSPRIIRHFLRPQDRLIACELHPEDAQVLRGNFRNDKQVHVHHRSGYEAIQAFLPFPEKRGLILIDPPFESTGEIAHLVRAAKTIYARMPAAVTAIWYPIKDRPSIWHFHESLQELKIPEMMMAEFMFLGEERADRLNGTGLVFINAPWTFDDTLRRLFPLLHDVLQTESQASEVRMLTGPKR